MLDRVKAAQKLTTMIDQVFVDTSDGTELAYAVWQRIITDSTFIYKVRQAQAPWSVPSWSESLSTIYTIDQQQCAYRVLAIDGSQIYPDRHQGIACFLINIGSVLLSYGLSGKAVQCGSVPYLFHGSSDTEQELESSVDVVNCRRQELELQAGLEYVRSVQYKDYANDPFIILYDGSLIFWHLDTKDTRLKDVFLPRYLALLYQLYQERILIASYISFPKSKELVNLIRLSLCDFDATREQAYQAVNHVVDAAVMYRFLELGQRTIVFKNNAKISESYPEQVSPYFFYINVGNEIGRVEIPAWIAQDTILVDTIAHFIFDQNHKGRGYPVALAEAHEQAVVKGPDRDFFYHLLSKMCIERKQRLLVSQKVIKKRGIGI